MSDYFFNSFTVLKFIKPGAEYLGKHSTAESSVARKKEL